VARGKALGLTASDIGKIEGKCTRGARVQPSLHYALLCLKDSASSAARTERQPEGGLRRRLRDQAFGTAPMQLLRTERIAQSHCRVRTCEGARQRVAAAARDATAGRCNGRMGCLPWRRRRRRRQRQGHDLHVLVGLLSVLSDKPVTRWRCVRRRTREEGCS
jgi:hypothetical protein